MVRYLQGEGGPFLDRKKAQGAKHCPYYFSAITIYIMQGTGVVIINIFHRSLILLSKYLLKLLMALSQWNNRPLLEQNKNRRLDYGTAAVRENEPINRPG